MSALVCCGPFGMLFRGLKGSLNSILWYLEGLRGPSIGSPSCREMLASQTADVSLCSRVEDKIPKPDGVELLRVGGGLICYVLIT